MCHQQMMAEYKRLEYLPPPDPTESIVEGSQFYLLPSYTRRDVAISGKNTALLKSVMTSGAAIKTQPEPGVEIERISIHLPTSEGIVRITPETLHLFQLEVLPLMYRNGCVEVPVANLLHTYIQAVLGSPVHINHFGLTGNIVIIENLQMQLHKPQSGNQRASNGAYVLSVHYVLGVMCNHKKQSMKINKAKFFIVPSLDHNVQISKVEACLLGLAPVYIRFEDDLEQAPARVQTTFYHCTKLRNDGPFGKKKVKKLNVKLNLYLDNGMIEFTTKELFALFFQRNKDFIHNIDRNRAAPEGSAKAELFTVRHLDKSLRQRITGYSYRTGIQKNQVVTMKPDQALTHKIMPVCINKCVIGFQYLDVYNPNVNHMMQSQLVLGNTQWAGRIALIEIVKDEQDCFKYILGVLAEKAPQIPKPVPQREGVGAQTVSSSHVRSVSESRPKPIESTHNDAGLVDVYTYHGAKQLTWGDVDFLKPSQVSGVDDSPDALERLLRAPQTLKQIISRIEQQLNIFNGDVLIHESLTVEQSEGVRLRILTQGDLLSKHFVTDQFGFVLPQDMERRRIHCYHIHTLRGYVALFPNVMDEFEAEIVPLSITGLFVKLISDFRTDARLTRMLLPFLRFWKTNKEGRLALIETRPLEGAAEGQSEDYVYYVGVMHHRWYESDKMEVIESDSIQLFKKSVCMKMSHGESLKFTYREARCIGLQNRTKHDLKSQNMPQESTSHLKKTAPVRSYCMTADSIGYSRCELSSNAAERLKIGDDSSCFKLVVIDSNDKYDVHSYVVWTSKGLVHLGPHAVYGHQTPTMYFTIDLRLSRRGGLKIIPFCLGKACVSVAQKDLSSPEVLGLLQTRSRSSNARVILIYCVQSEGNKEASQKDFKIGFFLGLMVNVVRHSLCPADPSCPSAVDEAAKSSKWGLNTYQYLTPEAFENIPFRISDKEVKLLCSEKQDTILYAIPMNHMGLFRIQGYHLLTSKGFVVLPPYGVVAKGLGVAAIDIDPSMNIGEGFKVVPVRNDSFLVGLKCFNPNDIQLRNILDTEVRVKTYSRKGRAVLIETQAQFLLGILVGDWNNFSASSHCNKLETYEYVTLKGVVSLDRKEVVELGLQQEETPSPGGSKLPHKIEFTSHPNERELYFPEQSELTALNFLSPAPGDPVIGWKRMTNLTVEVTYYHLLTSTGKLIVPHYVVESMDLRVLPIVLKSGDDYFIAGAVTRQLGLPRINHILSFATKIGRIVAIEIVMQEADKVVFEPNKYLFGVLTRIPNASAGKAVECRIRTLNQGLIRLPHKEFVQFGFKDVTSNKGASITVFGDITDVNAPILGISKWNGTSIRESLENTLLFFTTADRLGKYIIESCFLLTSYRVVEISQSYFDSEGIKLVPLSIDNRIFLLKTINIAYPQIKSLLETTLMPLNLQKKCRIVFLKVTCESDLFIERRMEKERQSLSFCGGHDYYLLGILVPPWDRHKPRSKRSPNSKRSDFPTPEGNIHIDYKESAILGLRQLHSDSEDDEGARAAVEKKFAPISSIEMRYVRDAVDPPLPKLSVATTSKVVLKLTRGIANVTKATSNCEQLLNLQAILGNTLISLLPLSVSQRVVVGFQIATRKGVLRLSGSTVLDKLFGALPWHFSREEQGYRLTPLCVDNQVVAVKQVRPIHMDIVTLMRIPIVLDDLNVNARLVVVQTLGKTPSACQLKPEEQFSDFLGIMFNNRGFKTIPRNVKPLTRNYVTLPTLDGPIQVDRKESVRLGLREPHSDSEYGSDDEASTSGPNRSAAKRSMPSSSSPNLPESKRPKKDEYHAEDKQRNDQFSTTLHSHQHRQEGSQKNNNWPSGSRSSTRFDAGSSTNYGSSQHTNAPPNPVSHHPQDPSSPSIKLKTFAQLNNTSGYQHNQPTPSYGNSSNSPNFVSVPPTRYGNPPKPVPPPSNPNASVSVGSRFDHPNYYGNEFQSTPHVPAQFESSNTRNLNLDRGRPSTSQPTGSKGRRSIEEEEAALNESLVTAKSELVHAWTKWFSGTERHPRYNDIWNDFCTRRTRELQIQGKQPNNHDLLFEWNGYWEERMKNMFTTECGLKFEEISKRFTIPSDLKKDILKKAITVAADIFDTIQPISTKDSSTPRSTDGTSTSGGADIPSVSGRDDRTSLPSVKANAAVDKGSTNLVSVLRLLMAIEEKLGSFSSKIMQLLHHALRMERNCENSSSSLLEDESVCIVVEAVGEKLRGQILAGMVSGNEERVMQRTITEIGQLLALQGR